MIDYKPCLDVDYRALANAGICDYDTLSNTMSSDIIQTSNGIDQAIGSLTVHDPGQTI